MTMPLNHLLDNILLISKEFHLSYNDYQNWPYWKFEDLIERANIIMKKINDSSDTNQNLEDMTKTPSLPDITGMQNKMNSQLGQMKNNFKIK